ncbi:hypothetical protein L1987_19388 [Smallanthus sonchifolius]|uniref:Uncharacterized protein n=1 Tax=Smallanthus sonchifolius TaxID=185202 RepID=A0ACB9IQ39_9ASTR|nr:hypothetical protein L1987_19388 [Smallanthus sonchifolius]
MANNSVSYLIFILIVVVLAISEIATVKGKICEKPSKTWFGTCKDAEKCDQRCIDWEGAKHGSCHQREAQYMCFCYFDCDPKKNPGPPPGAPKPPPGAPPPESGPGQPAPPGAGEGPPPPGGGEGGGGGGEGGGGAPPPGGGEGGGGAPPPGGGEGGGGGGEGGGAPPG